MVVAQGSISLPRDADTRFAFSSVIRDIVAGFDTFLKGCGEIIAVRIGGEVETVNATVPDHEIVSTAEVLNWVICVWACSATVVVHIWNGTSGVLGTTSHSR